VVGREEEERLGGEEERLGEYRTFSYSFFFFYPLFIFPSLFPYPLFFPSSDTKWLERRAPQATSLAHLRRRASEKKWPEARAWCERRNLNKGYVLRKKGKPDPTPARAEKRTASRFYQLMLGHALMGVYLKSMDNWPDDHCWWCDPENISGTQQTRDHLFKHCHRWKDQQATLWARVKEATKKGKQKW